MNKQEFQQTIKNMKPLKFFTATTLSEAYKAGFEEAKGNALCNSCFLNEPEKPVVPQFVADWIEMHKRNAPFLKYLFTNNQDEELQNWLVTDENQNSMAKAWLFGYEVEKEKLYIAKNKQTGEYLCYCFKFFHDKHSSSRFTAEEKRWKELGYWGNDLYVFEEAEGEDEQATT